MLPKIVLGQSRNSFVSGLAALVLSLSLSACGGGGSGNSTPPSYSIGGTVSGLSGSGLVLQDNAGDDLSVDANGNFTFPTTLENLSAYSVTVKTQPGTPKQTCSVSNGSGNLAGSNISNVSVTCVTNQYSISGVVSGLSGSGLVLRNNGGDDLDISADGNFTFATKIADLDGYNVTVSTQPDSPPQVCSVSQGSGHVASTDVTNVDITCINAYSIGGNVSGLSGTGLVLQDNSGDDLAIGANGAFTFSTSMADTQNYAVTVRTQPAVPNQTCLVSNGSGTLSGADISNVSVVCVTNTYSIGGTVTGLSGTGLVLQNNAGDDLSIGANGNFSFATSLDDLSAYSVSVKTQPSAPAQTCAVSNGGGNLAGGNVSNIAVTCVTNQYTIAGTVSGLSGSGLVLQDNGGDNLAVSANGNFAFATKITDFTNYNVTVLSQPGSPSQTCSVSNGTGTVASADVGNVSVTCVTDKFVIGGTVTGLSGSGLVLHNNGGDNLSINADGSFSFATSITDLNSYAVTVFTQPGSPNQTCSISNGSGSVNGGDVSNVSVNCVTNQYSIGGNVSGLSGSGLVLQDNSGDDLAVSSDGGFTFATSLEDLSAYSVTVKTQPSTPSQTCSVTNGNSALAGADVTNVSVSCVTNQYSIGGTVSGLSGSGLVLQNNNGDDLAVSADGSFTFATSLDDLSAYSVTVQTQPSTPEQTCTVSNAGGTLAGADISNVSVSCVTNQYTTGGTVSGLSGSGLVLQNNNGDDLAVSTDGGFTFATALDDLSAYSVTVKTQPSVPAQTCTVTNASGNLAGGNVSNVSISCVTNQYTIGGTVSGLSGSGLVLQNNSGDDLAVSADGGFTFAISLDDLSAYSVTVKTQPSTPSQTCSVTNGDSTLAGADVTNVSISCVTNQYTIGGTVSGLSGSGLVLQNNNGDDLTVSTDGGFTFATSLDDLSAYSVTVKTQPSVPAQTCTVSNDTGNLAGSNVGNVSVSCVTNQYTIGGTVSGLSGSGLVLQNNNGDDLAVNADGGFSFATKITDLTDYSVTVLTQPGTPNQTCTVSGGTGTVASADVNTVSIACVTNQYTIGGSVSGLSGSGLVLQNNNGDNLAVSADGSFTFATKINDLDSYSVTVFSQPGSPLQLCSVSSGSGNVAGADVTNVTISCSNAYTIGGTVSGLSGSGLVLQDNNGDDLSIGADGSFTFATPIVDTKAYAVTVHAQPSTPAQTCSVTNGSGTVNAANVSNVSISCVTNQYTIGGTVSGLSGSGLVLQDNNGDDLTVSTNGGFTFATALDDLSAYSVTVKTQPSTPAQSCTVSNAGGNLAGSNISNVAINCVTNQYTIGGTVSGLAGSGLVLRNNAGDDLSVSANGSFTFATALDDLSAYSVTVYTQPSSLSQTCSVSNGSGNLASSNVSNVSISCVTNQYTIGGTVAGLTGSGLVLQVNGTDDLSVSANGSFTFATPLDDGTAYSVSVKTQPGSPAQNCLALHNLDMLAGQNVSNVYVICAATDTWVWLSGSSTINQTGSFGTQGVTSASNMPPGRSDAVSWKDANDNYWIFGGLIYEDPNTHDAFVANDLWKFDGAQWTWVKGSSTTNVAGVYGVKGVADAANTPGAREGAVRWTDSSGQAWVFGGYGYDSAGTLGILNDLWMFDGTDWTWVSGSEYVNAGAVYGSQGVADAANVPGARHHATGWADASNHLWLFGGAGTGGSQNDLWMFDGTDWTWVGGNSTVDHCGVYGTQGVAAAANMPGARYTATSWTDSSGNFWLFGGKGYDKVCVGGSKQLMNDLWKFDGTNWTWVGGSDTHSDGGNANYPGARNGATSWIDSNDNVWLYGGFGISLSATTGELGDLWKYNGTSWTWVSGSNTINDGGDYSNGLNASGQPGARDSATGWLDSTGRIVLFGGYGFSGSQQGYLNDIWNYQP